MISGEDRERREWNFCLRMSTLLYKDVIGNVHEAYNDRHALCGVHSISRALRSPDSTPRPYLFSPRQIAPSLPQCSRSSIGIYAIEFLDFACVLDAYRKMESFIQPKVSSILSVASLSHTSFNTRPSAGLYAMTSFLPMQRTL